MKIKQLFVGVAMVGLLGMVPSLARAEVTSDVVGYTTMDLEAGKWYLIGTPFADCAGGDVKLNDHLVSGFHAGDKLMLYHSGEGYTGFVFKSGLSGDQSSGWCTAFGKSPVDVTLDPGVAAFVQMATSTTLTFAGKVQISVAFEFGSEEGNIWEQVVSPACSDTKLNDLIWEGLSAKDKIMFYTSGVGYTGYVYKTGLGEDGTGSGWCTAFGKTPVDFVVKAGEAFLIQKVSAGKGYVSVQ